MTFKDTGFRAFYKTFVALMLTDDLRDSLHGFPGEDKANCLLTYGYIDPEAGLTLEVLAGGEITEAGARFFDGNDEIRSMIRIQSAENVECLWLKDLENLTKHYQKKLEQLRSYDASDEVEKTRSMEFLDESRDLYRVDDVLVYLTREGLEPEGCWVRIFGLGDHWLMGHLLNEPGQDFGYHMGEEIGFFLREVDNGKVICYTDMTPSRKLTAEDLEDGTLLKNAVREFNHERTQDHLFEILELMRDSYVWIPCNAVLSEEDQERWYEELKDGLEENPEDLIGMELTNENEIRLIPDILQNGEKFFFPVFSSAEEMGEYGDHFSKVEKHFLEALILAKNNKADVTGIVLNAFSEPFVLDKEPFDLVENMKTRLV